MLLLAVVLASIGWQCTVCGVVLDGYGKWTRINRQLARDSVCSVLEIVLYFG